MANSDNNMQTTQFELHYDGPVSKGVGHVVLEAATTIAAIQASPTKGKRSTNAPSILSPASCPQCCPLCSLTVLPFCGP